jgi:hypothetical protein
VVPEKAKPYETLSIGVKEKGQFMSNLKLLLQLTTAAFDIIEDGVIKDREKIEVGGPVLAQKRTWLLG